MVLWEWLGQTPGWVEVPNLSCFYCRLIMEVLCIDKHFTYLLKLQEGVVAVLMGSQW
jgi:hypothetical protein